MEELYNLNDLKAEPDLRINVSDIVDDLKEYPFIYAIILFGSYAKDKPKPYSDVDLCVITDNDLSFDKKVAICSNSSDKIDISIFRDLPTMIQFRVFKEGKLLYCRDSMFLHRTKVRTIKRYLDFRPVIDRHLRKIFSGA